MVEPAAVAEAAPTATDTPAATETPAEATSPAEAPATEAPSPAATEANPVTAEDKAVAPDWTATGSRKGTVEVVEEGGVRYNKLLRMITGRTLPSLRKRGWKWTKTAMPVST